MQTPWDAEPGVELVVAAQRGDRNALDALAAAYLPLVYNVVGRAMNGHHDVDDVVQETMLRAVRGVDQLRDPEAFRSWLMAIAIRQVRDSYRDRLAQAPAADLADEVPSPDFADLTVQRLGLTGQRHETAEATRWLDDEDRPVLAVWWQEAAGEISRAELADALGLSPAHAAVRIARMKERLMTSRTVVRALRKAPQCGGLAVIATGWEREPGSLWRKRLARHVRDCAWCLSDVSDMVPAERLLSRMPLLPVPAALAGSVLGGGALAGSAVAGRGLAARVLGRGRGRGTHGSHAQHAQHARLLPKAVVALQPKIVAVAVATVTITAGGAFAAVHVHRAAAPAALSIAAPPTPSHVAVPHPKPTPKPSHKPTPKPAPKPSHKPTPTPKPTPVTVTSQRKGVSTWNFSGVSQALTESGASWYYNWGATPNGITAPSTASFVPMIWGAPNVTTATMDQVKQEGNVLLGFNEPDMSGQANMTVSQALGLWPQLMSTGMTLGSPAVAFDAATPGGWLDQFMTGAKARGYRVNFITVHWYGGNFSTGPAVQELESYLQAIYARYHLPIWVTEFALTSFAGSTATYPTEAQQAAFMTAAASMLDRLSYIQRYAWFALPTSAGSGTTGLFDPGPSVTQVGRAFEAAS
jgi:RNA polymerase sigma factor (sigma-70 family)